MQSQQYLNDVNGQPVDLRAYLEGGYQVYRIKETGEVKFSPNHLVLGKISVDYRRRVKSKLPTSETKKLKSDIIAEFNGTEQKIPDAPVLSRKVFKRPRSTNDVSEKPANFTFLGENNILGFKRRPLLRRKIESTENMELEVHIIDESPLTLN